jgi:hypothetical protein
VFAPSGENALQHEDDETDYSMKTYRMSGVNCIIIPSYSVDPRSGYKLPSQIYVPHTLANDKGRTMLPLGIPEVQQAFAVHHAEPCVGLSLKLF